jgi:hypothetical protein
VAIVEKSLCFVVFYGLIIKSATVLASQANDLTGNKLYEIKIQLAQYIFLLTQIADRIFASRLGN